MIGWKLFASSYELFPIFGMYMTFDSRQAVGVYPHVMEASYVVFNLDIKMLEANQLNTIWSTGFHWGERCKSHADAFFTSPWDSEGFKLWAWV